jgi:methanogenic corrinoid protein MtbC1
LSLSQLEQLLAESTEREVGEHYASFVEHALAGADGYRPDQCDEALGLAMATLSPREVVSEVFSPLLHEAGERWRRGALSMAQEHMLTASVERLLMATIHLYQKIAVGPRLMFGTLGGERHGIGSLMAAFIASAQGFRGCYLGPDLPPEELAQAVKKSGALALGLSLVSLRTVKDPVDQLRRLGKLLSKDIQVWLGGPAVGQLARHKPPRRCALVRSFEDYVQRLDMLKLVSAR